MNRTRTEPSRFTGTLTIAIGIALAILLCIAPAGAGSLYAPTVSLISPQAAYNTSAINITNLAGTYAVIGAGVSLMPAGYKITPVSAGVVKHGDGGALLDGAHSVFVKGTKAYVASVNDNALEVVNIADPAHPVHYGSLTNGTGGALLDGPWSVFVYGRYAYVASSRSNALEIVNIANPAAPSHVSSVKNNTGSSPPYLLNTPSGVFVANQSDNTKTLAYVVSTGTNSLQIIDVTNPAAPMKMGSIHNASTDYYGKLAFGNLSVPRGIHVSGQYAYITSELSNGVQIVDISNAWSPRAVAFIGNTTPGAGALLKNPYDIKVVGNYAYIVSYGSDAFEVINVTNREKPTYAGRIVNGQGGAQLKNPMTLAINGIYAYVGDLDSNRLEFIDISNPVAPLHKGYYAFPASHGPNGVFAQGNYAFVANNWNKSLNIISVPTGTISASGVKVINGYREATRIVCTIPLKNQPAGQYSVVVTNPDLQQGILPKGFTISKPPVIPAEPYPGWKYRGVLNGSGVFDDGGSRPSGTLFWNSTSVKFVTASPVVKDGFVYTSGPDPNNGIQTLYALFVNNGSVKWRYYVDDRIYGAPAVANGRLFVGTGNSRTTARTFYALNATTGALLWKNTSSLGGFSASPTVYNGMVIAGRDDANISAWNVTNGREVWRFQTTGSVFSPAVANGSVVFSTKDWNLFSIDAATGKKVWDGRNSSSGWDGSIVLQSGPAVAYGKIYIGTSQYVRAYDEVTGALLYQYFISGAALDGAPAVANGLVHIATTGGSPGLSGGNGIYTLFANNLTLKWVNHTPENTVMTASPAVANGVLYITSDRANNNAKGFLYAWNASTGKPVWSFHLEGGGTQSSPAVQDGVVYAGQWWQGFLAIGNQHPLFLTSPNGGVILKRGTSQTIRWAYNGSVGTTVRIELLKGKVVNRVISAGAPIGAKGSGGYVWPILANQTVGTDYQIRITSGGKVDTSNGFFAVSA